MFFEAIINDRNRQNIVKFQIISFKTTCYMRLNDLQQTKIWLNVI